MAYYEQCLVIDHALGNRHGEGNTLAKLARTAVSLGALERAIQFATRARNLLQELGAQREEGEALVVLGTGYAALGERASARAALAAALDLL